MAKTLPDTLEVVPDIGENDGLCESLWASDRCRAKAAWHIVNTTNGGHAYMCSAHASRFRMLMPDAAVNYVRIGE